MTDIQRNNPQKDGDNVYRFYKSNLPGVIWDNDKNCSLVEFEEGVFETKIKRTAKILLDKGYLQVDPNAIQPPNVIVALPGSSLEMGQNAALAGENKQSKAMTPVLRKVE